MLRSGERKVQNSKHCSKKLYPCGSHFSNNGKRTGKRWGDDGENTYLIECLVTSAIIYNSGTNKGYMDENEFLSVLSHLYEKTLILQDPGQFNKVLYFYLIDSLAHIDYTAGIYAFNILSPKNIMGGEYLRWRIDEEKKGDRAKFSGFINWLKENHPAKFVSLPSLWQMIYDTEDPASYRSFRIVLDPDSRNLIPTEFFFVIIDEFFETEFLKSLYEDASLSTLFKTYIAQL